MGVFTINFSSFRILKKIRMDTLNYLDFIVVLENHIIELGV